MFVFHKKCASGYKKCRQMIQLEKNLEEFTKLVQENNEILEIPSKCVPFLGTKQRNFLELSHCHRRCIKKREAVAAKSKLKLGWTWKKMKEMDTNISISSDGDSSADGDTSATLSISSVSSTEASNSINSINSSNTNGTVHLFADVREPSPVETVQLLENMDAQIQSESSEISIQSPNSENFEDNP